MDWHGCVQLSTSSYIHKAPAWAFGLSLKQLRNGAGEKSTEPGFVFTACCRALGDRERELRASGGNITTHLSDAP